MKQNKLTMMAVTIFVAMALTACGAQGQNNSTNTGSSTSTSSQSSSESSSQVQQISSVFGCVSQVAGNELTLELAKEPNAPEQAEESSGEMKEEMPATAMTPAQPAGEAGGQQGAEERVELEYSGETKDIVIPGGLKITGSNGEEKQLSDIQKGSILTVFTDQDGQVMEVILHG